MLAFKSPLCYLIMAPKCKNSDAGNSGMPKRSCKVLPLSEKVKVLNLTKHHIIIHYHKKGEYSVIRYFKRVRKRPYSHNFYYSILL